ncbi:alpha/beta fold hydrolase, partial [Micromonospora sp. NPDC001898]|uniref:alpha/beta fold hydrolase n=1 Tax=Micromonospora sp. NPDC001898 TaxID=3364221 RepID=UPI0036A40C75
MLLLHGIGRTLADFAEQHDLLARDHRVVSLDLAGHGGSAPLDEPHTLPALARATADCLDALGVGRPPPPPGPPPGPGGGGGGGGGAPPPPPPPRPRPPPRAAPPARG